MTNHLIITMVTTKHQLMKQGGSQRFSKAVGNGGDFNDDNDVYQNWRLFQCFAGLWLFQ